MIATLYADVRPSARDLSASLTAVGMGEMTYAMDMIVSCVGLAHQTRSDGSCRCGLYKINTRTTYDKAA